MTDKPTISSERMLHKDYDRKSFSYIKGSGNEPQEARLQDEIIAGKRPAEK
jgi:hypothetical protein